jgi:DinB superfamily
MSTLSKIIDDYVAGGSHVRKAVAGMTREQLLARPVPGKWSTFEVVCHLADSEQAWAHRIKRVLAEDRPLLIGYDESRFSSSLAYHQLDLEEELALIELTRNQLARVLKTLSADALGRTGIHSERGSVTLEQMLHIEIEHIAHHLRFVQAKRKALGLAAD